MCNSHNFAGKRILITGASRGIGREIAGLLAELGARVTVLARHRDTVERCVASLAGSGHRALMMDVGSEHAWQTAASSGALDEIDGLVTAAAVLAPVGPIGSYSAREFWQTMQVNVLGTLLALQACLDSLEAAGGAVVTFAGGGATSPLCRYDAYAASKVAVARLSENLALELSERGVRVNAVSPGFVATDLHAATLEAGRDKAGARYFAETARQIRTGGASARPAAELTAFLLSSAAAGITGRLISAQWDPWQDLAFQQRLRRDPSLATLRRIDDKFYSHTRSSNR